MRDEIDRFSAMTPHRCSLQEILNMREPWRAAKFIHNEVPVRYAERIRSIESIPGWERSPNLVDVHQRHVMTFQNIRLVKTRASRSTFSVPELVDSFTEVVQSAVGTLQDMVPHLADAVHTLHRERGDDFDGAFVDRWLDDFLLNYIGSQMLLSQYLACVRGRPTGIIESNCDVPRICQQAVAIVSDLHRSSAGRVPKIVVETASAKSGSSEDTHHFSYIPEFLKFMLVEILDNSCRATLSSYHDRTDLRPWPITVVVCGDAREVVIRVADRARGIPFEVGKSVWSYLYSEAPESGTCTVSSGEDQFAITLAGHGAGLPLSRLYARYLGGSLDLVSWPGYGTDVFINLPRLSSKQVEVVPDADDDVDA